MAKGEMLPFDSENVAFAYNGVAFRFDDRRFIDLTAMWKANGEDPAKKPSNWRRKDGRGFIADLARSLNVPLGHIIVGERGKGGSTHGHWQIALAYAKYLSHDFHRLVNEAFRQYAAEEADPALKMERSVKKLIRQGRQEDWILERVEGVIQRNSFTSTLRDHNCRTIGSFNPYAEATRSISMAATGKTPSEYKKDKGLPASARTRDHMSKVELNRTRFAESEAENLVKEEAADGNEQCMDAVRRASQAVKVAIASLTKKTG